MLRQVLVPIDPLTRLKLLGDSKGERELILIIAISVLLW